MFWEISPDLNPWIKWVHVLWCKNVLLLWVSIIHVIQRVHNWTLSLTQRSSGFVLELSFSVSFIDGIEERRHVLSKTPEPIGATALHGLQVPSVGFNRPLENSMLSPKDTQRGHFIVLLDNCAGNIVFNKGAGVGFTFKWFVYNFLAPVSYLSNPAFLVSSCHFFTSSFPVPPWHHCRHAHTDQSADPEWKYGASSSPVQTRSAPYAASWPDSLLLLTD